MSDVITKLRKLGLDNDNQQNQQGQTQAIAQASVANTPQPLMAPSTQQTALKLGSLIPAGNPKLRAMVEEVKGFSIIEKAILAMVVFENDEVVNKIKPEDWVNLIKDKIGEEYAEAFRAWLESRGIKVGVQQ